MNDFGKNSAEWGEGNMGSSFIAWSFFLQESPISFLAIGNMTMCKILKDLSKELLPKGEKSTVFIIKTTFGNWNFFDLLPYLWNEKSFQYLDPIHI